MTQMEKEKMEPRLEFLNKMMACRYDLQDRLCTMQMIKAAGDFAKDCISTAKISRPSEVAFYEKSIQNIAVTSIYKAMINNKNTCIEIEKCLEDISYLEKVVDEVEEIADDLLIKSIVESIKQDVLAKNSIFTIDIRKYDELRVIYEGYVKETN